MLNCMRGDDWGDMKPPPLREKCLDFCDLDLPRLCPYPVLLLLFVGVVVLTLKLLVGYPGLMKLFILYGWEV